MICLTGTPKVKYCIKALKITRPMSLRSHNIITIQKLADISAACNTISFGIVYRAVFLMGFFAFLRLSNLAPHVIASFDFARHLTGDDIFFTKKIVKVLIKWSTTNQTRDKVQCITLPKLKMLLFVHLRPSSHCTNYIPDKNCSRLDSTHGFQGQKGPQIHQLGSGLEFFIPYLS